MAGQPIVDVVFGLVFIFFVFSLLCSGANELISRALDKRARFLEAAVWQLLDRGSDSEARALWFTAFWDHPLIRQLARPVDMGWVQQFPLRVLRFVARIGQGRQLKAVENVRREARVDPAVGPAFLSAPDSPTVRPMYSDEGRVLPSYIPGATFALVALDIERRHPLPEGAGANAPLHRLLDSVGRGVQVQMSQARAEVERWFDSEMDRITGWYKRETKAVLVGIAVVVVVLGNVDTVAMARTLWTEPAVRELVAGTADQVLAQAAASAQAQASTTMPPTTMPPTTVAGSPTTLVTSPGPGAPTVPSTSAPAAGPPALPTVACVAPTTTKAAGPSTTARAATAATTTTTTTQVSDLVQLLSANQCVRRLAGAGLPIGWPKPPLCLKRGQAEAAAPCAKGWGRLEDIVVRRWRAGFGSLLLMLGGWGLSVGALSMGAPFWWDRLNRLGSLRSTGPKPKSSTS